MKKVYLITALLSAATVGLVSSAPVIAAPDVPDAVNFVGEVFLNDTIVDADIETVYEYTKEELDEVVFTMDMFNEAFSREDVAQLILEEKGANAAISREYQRFNVTEEEIDEFYAEMEAIAARAPSLSYYFSNVYWRNRNVAYYGTTVTLTLVPTSVIRNDPDQNHRAAAWLLVKNTCGSSDKWTNEASISKQFDCHYMGEVLAYRGVIGAVGDWDIEPIRPAYGAFTYTVNKCNPTG